MSRLLRVLRRVRDLWPDDQLAWTRGAVFVFLGAVLMFLAGRCA